MKAVVFTKAGPPEVLRLEEIEKPIPRAREVLVKIHATTVTAGDVLLRRMRGPMRWIFSLSFGLGKNSILGHEFSGVVEAVGSDVTRFKQGDAVFGSTGNRGGAYAEFICVPEDAMLTAKPTNLTHRQAAAVPIGANTALHILEEGDIQPDDDVLIFGASGSVGTYAVQLARYKGATVTGVCSTANLEMVRSLGAQQVIDYTRDDFTQEPGSYDVVFDAVGKLSPSDSKRALKQGGVFLSVRSMTKERVENLIFLRELIEAGEIEPVIDRTYALGEIVEAHRYVDDGHKKGNVVITIP